MQNAITWINDLITELHRSQLEAKSQLSGAVFILLIYYAMKKFKDRDTCISRTSMMSLFEMIGSSICTSLDQLTSIIKDDKSVNY